MDDFMKINLKTWQLVMVALFAFACDSEDSKESNQQTQGGSAAGSQGGVSSIDMLASDLDQKITIDMMGNATTDMQTAGTTAGIMADMQVAGAMGGQVAGTMGGVMGGIMGGSMMPVENPTYHKDVRPIIDKHCLNCHNGQSVAPYDFNDHELTVSMGNTILFDIENGNMPPWYVSDDCAPLKEKLKLADFEVQTIRNWVEQGKVVGDEIDFVAPVRINPDINSEVLVNAEQIEIFPSEAYVVPQDRVDDFRCFTISSPFMNQRSVIGYEALIDNEMVAHHMLILSLDGSDANRNKIQELEAQDDQPGFDCYGVPSFEGLKLLGAWAPGGGKVGFPQSTGLEIKENSIFVVQMHYNTILGRGVDQSGAKLWFAPPQAASLPAELVFVGNLPFEIPAGVNGMNVPEEECDVVYGMSDDAFPRPLRGVHERDASAQPSLVGRSGCVIQELYYQTDLPLKVFAAFPHMHTKGKSLEISLSSWNEQDGQMQVDPNSEKCMIKTTRWDFNWQKTYWFEQPIRNYTKGKLKLVCRFDNSQGTEPIQLGEGTMDEMCLGLLYVSLGIGQ